MAQEGLALMRREIQLTWLCIAVVLLSSKASVWVGAAPILGPDLNSCRPAIPPRGTQTEWSPCCFVDTGKPIKDFQYNPALPMRVRKAVHKLDEEFILKYERAYELMRALPPSDPRSWKAQSDLHCAYCAAAYSQFNSSATLDVHHGWLLLPFHRWYVYFHERILASLIGDDTFAIPYWAWDVQNETSPPANVMPAMFMKMSSPLFDPFRCHLHRPPNRVDLKIQLPEPYNSEPELLLRNNYHNMWRVMIGQATTPEEFFGGKVSLGEAVESKAGRFELGPHGAVHKWTGDEHTPFGEDMSPAYSAARDPLFFAHHSQVDRLWMMWNDLGGRNFDDPDWLDSEFLFYDENAEMVRVNIRGCLDMEKLGISYDQVPADWLEYSPTSIREMDSRYSRNVSLGRMWRQLLAGEMMRNIAMMFGRFFRIAETETEVVLGRGRAVVTKRVARPKFSSEGMLMGKISNGNGSSVYDEVLVLSGVVTKPFDATLLFNIFLELPESDGNTPEDCAESLGGVYLEPEGLQNEEERTITRKFTHSMGIGKIIRILGIESHESVTVTFIPAWDSKHDPDILVRFTELRLKLALVSH